MGGRGREAETVIYSQIPVEILPALLFFIDYYRCCYTVWVGKLRTQLWRPLSFYSIWFTIHIKFCFRLKQRSLELSKRNWYSMIASLISSWGHERCVSSLSGTFTRLPWAMISLVSHGIITLYSSMEAWLLNPNLPKTSKSPLPLSLSLFSESEISEREAVSLRQFERETRVDDNGGRSDGSMDHAKR